MYGLVYIWFFALHTNISDMFSNFQLYLYYGKIPYVIVDYDSCVLIYRIACDYTPLSRL